MYDIICIDEYGNGVTHLTQWDKNQTLYINNWNYNAAPIFHFCNKQSKESLPVSSAISDGKLVVKIPNILLQTPLTIFAYLYLYGENGSAKTVATISIPVRPKQKPKDYIYIDNTEVLTTEALVGSIQILDGKVSTIYEEFNNLDSKIDGFIQSLINSDEDLTNSEISVLIRDAESKIQNSIQESYAYWKLCENGLNGVIKTISSLKNEIKESNDLIQTTKSDLEESIAGCKSDTETTLQDFREEIDEFIEEKVSQNSDPKVCVIMDNDGNLQVRSKWNGDNDIVVRALINKSNNQTFTLSSIRVIPSDTPYKIIKSEGSSFKNSGDDIPGVNYNGSTSGGGHGYSGIYKALVTTPYDDSIIGSKIINNGNEYTVITIKPNSEGVDEIYFGIPSQDEFSNLDEIAPSRDDYWLDGTTQLTISSQTGTAITPAVNHRKINIYVDGVELYPPSSGTIIKYGDCVELHESYNIVDIKAAMKYLRDNKDNGINNTRESYYSDDIEEYTAIFTDIYQFTERGAITCLRNTDFDRPVRLGFARGIMAQRAGNHYIFPGTTDCYTLQTFIPASGVPENDWGIDRWADINNPPNRFYNFSSGSLTNGICIGYNTEYGLGKAEHRKNNTYAVRIGAGTGGKLYPLLFGDYNDSAEPVLTEANDSIKCVAYYCPVGGYDEDIPSVCWYYVGDDIYLLIDVQKTVNKYLELPDYMNGRHIEIVEKYGDIKIPHDFVVNMGLKVAVNNYGSVVLKLTK